MKKEMAERYQLQYLVLVDEFLKAVELGADWLELKPLINEMKKVCVCLECIEGFHETGDSAEHTWSLQVA